MSTPRSAINARINERVARAVGQRKYDLWIQPSVRLDYEDAGHILHVAVPNRFVADKVRNDFSEALREAARAEAGMSADDELRLELCIAPDRFAAPAAPNPSRAAKDDAETVESAKPGHPRRPSHPANAFNPATRDPALAGPLRHRFEDFVVGPANELACAAAMSLVEVDADLSPEAAASGDRALQTCIPGAGGALFIHGECGMGKTHLLQAACRRLLERRPDARALY
ncbi:MAG: DnaA/Hda family protein, partial [Planctomycetota bacterium]